MRIDGLGPPAPLTPSAPAAPPAGAAAASAPSFTTAANAQTLALQQREQTGGGGGHGGGGHSGHGGNKALSAIDDIAARAALNVTSRAKSAAERIRDIETLRAELAEADDDEAPGERRSGERDEQPAGDAADEDGAG